ncbi:MAG: DUF1573 domain-containing protein [Anaerolineae bacterium]|nr:DUF1573 domain-containing protein [Anaerolineae bacterium]
MRLPAGAAVTSRIGEGCGTPTEPTTLQLDADTPVPAIGWSGPLGGHHVAGTRALAQRTRTVPARDTTRAAGVWSLLPWQPLGARSVMPAQIPVLNYDLGDIPVSSPVAYVYTIQTIGTAGLHLSNLVTSRGCTGAERATSVIPPGQRADLRVEWYSIPVHMQR